LGGAKLGESVGCQWLGENRTQVPPVWSKRLFGTGVGTSSVGKGRGGYSKGKTQKTVGGIFMCGKFGEKMSGKRG